MDKLTDSDEVRIARNAADVLENEAYKLAMTTMKAQIVQQWKDCPVRDKEGALLLLQLAKLADKFEGVLTGLIESGRFADHQIKIDSERNESKARQVMRRVL